MLIFKENYIITIPRYKATEMHSHAMQHIIISEKPIYLFADGKEYTNYNIVTIAGNVKHKIEVKSAESLVLLIDTSTALAQDIKQLWLFDRNVYVMNKPIKLSLSEKSETQIVSATEFILNEIGIGGRSRNNIVLDERIISVINGIQSGELLFSTVMEIASEISMSLSRLEHLFKKETGMRLKNYLLMIKLKTAYQIIQQGKSITEAAMRAGFSDSSHLAATAKRTTGISISNFFSSQR